MSTRCDECGELITSDGGGWRHVSDEPDPFGEHEATVADAETTVLIDRHVANGWRR